MPPLGKLKLTTDHYLLLLVSSFFLTVCAVELFSDGMFMDGLYYATISRNMAMGLGSFWQPHLTQTLFSTFYEHPPLAFGFQSLFFRVFGDNLLVERLYSLFTFAVTAYLMALIWQQIFGHRKNVWLPLLFYFSTGGVAWAAANNMLENTMVIFVCCSVYCYFKLLASGKRLWLVLAGFSLSLGLLTKGFFCLYVWGVPFFAWVVFRRISFAQCVSHSCWLISFTVLPIVFLFFAVSDARTHMLTYLSHQVMGSIKNVQTVDTRFAIVFDFISSTAIPLSFALLLLSIARLKQLAIAHVRLRWQWFFFFLALSLAGVLPIMISMKQRSFYILTVYPFFAIGLAIVILPWVSALGSYLGSIQKWQRALPFASWLMLLLGLTLSLAQINRVGRDHEMIYACRQVIEQVGKGATINICGEMFPVWSLHGYMARYGNVSLDADTAHKHPYFLSNGSCMTQNMATNYEKVDIGSDAYSLYRRVKP